MANKLELQAEYEKQFGEAPDGSLTKAELKSAMNTNNSGNEELPDIKECYWKNPVYFSNAKFGLQEGLVTKEAAAEYEKVTPDETKLADAVQDYDPKAKRIKEAKKRASNVEK